MRSVFTWVVVFVGSFFCELLNAQSSLPTPEQVLKQKRPQSWPESVDVEMDQSILVDENLKAAFVRSLSQAPSLLLEVPEEKLFGEGGIYQEAVAGEKLPEVSAKVTYWDSGQEKFSIRCGIRPQGSGSLSQSPKRNFRLRFSKDYGEGSLTYPLFSEKVEKFENLLIRNPTHDSWTVRWPEWRQNPRYVNDRWALETARRLGHLSPRQKWVHVYLNRIYWGVYALSERPDEHFAADHRGVEAKDLDFFNGAELREGSEEQRKKVEKFLAQEFKNTPESFERLEEFLDLSSLIDHVICQIYQGKSDWPSKNYFLVGNKQGAPRFSFGAWDSEIGFYEKKQGMGRDAQNALYHAPLSSMMFAADPSGAGLWFRHLRSSEEFRMMFADRFYELIQKEGALSPQKASGRYRSLLDEVTPLLLAEALRWGDSQRKPPYLPHGEEWEELVGPESWLFARFFPLRPIALKQHLREEALWPDLEPPTFYTRLGKKGETKFYLKNINQRGIIVYTTDGTDPRVRWTKNPRKKAKAFREHLLLPSGTRLKARILSHQKWSPLTIYQAP